MTATQQQFRRQRHWFLNVLIGGACAYLCFIAVWLVVRTVYGDRWWWLFLINAATPFLLAPLPCVLLFGLATRHPATSALSVVLLAPTMTLLFPTWFAGGRVDNHSLNASFSLMTYNTNRRTEHQDQVIAVIQAASPDIVALQELNPVTAAALARDLSDEYPYQILELEGNDMGVISRFPLQQMTDRLLEEVWADRPDRPLIVTVDTGDRTITLLSAHTSTIVFDTQHPDSMNWSVGARERQVDAIATFARNHHQPLIVAGDFNMTPFHRAYQIVTADRLTDVWPICGQGPGFTWPGDRRNVFGVRLPQWLVRIDYIFTSNEIQCLDAAIGPWDGFSDHRPVLARLAVTGAAQPDSGVSPGENPTIRRGTIQFTGKADERRGNL